MARRTTSTPKAACLTHRGILNNGRSIGDRMLLTHKDIVCSPPPLFQYATPPSSPSNLQLTGKLVASEPCSDF
jgi:hypothetical protein